MQVSFTELYQISTSDILFAQWTLFIYIFYQGVDWKQKPMVAPESNLELIYSLCSFKVLQCSWDIYFHN